MPPLTRVRVSYRCLDGVELDLTSPEDGKPSPFIALVGANGAGKTTVLDSIALAIYRFRGGEVSADFKGTAPIYLEFEDQQWIGWHPKNWPIGGRTNAKTRESTLYVRSGYVPDMEGAPLTQGPKGGLSPKLALLPQRRERQRIEPMRQRVDHVHQWWMHQHLEYPETARLDRLWQALAPFLGDRVYAGVNPETHLPQFHAGGALVDFNELSSGERRIIVLFMEIAMHCGEDGLVLFDEPEAHFHPAWQRRLPEALAHLLPRGQVIAATHSPFLVDSLSNHQVFALGDTPW